MEGKTDVGSNSDPLHVLQPGDLSSPCLGFLILRIKGVCVCEHACVPVIVSSKMTARAQQAPPGTSFGALQASPFPGTHPVTCATHCAARDGFLDSMERRLPLDVSPLP